MNTATLSASLVNRLYIDNLDNLSRDMNRAIECNGSEMLVALNSLIAEPINLSFLLGRILNEELLLDKVRQESYYHENGFHKLVLLSSKNFKLRLHHFGVAEQVPMENIHDHRWPFASSILAGSLKMDLFRLTDNPSNAEELFHFKYGSDKSSGSYSTDFCGKSLLRKYDTKIFNEGESYLMQPDELHRITNMPGEESITLILTGQAISRQCNLFARRPILDEEKTVKTYSTEDLTSILKNIRETVLPQNN